MIKTILLKCKMRKAGFKWLKVNEDIINTYRRTTKNNKETSDFLVNFKLVRATYCGHLTSINDTFKIIEYGYLTIKVDRLNNKIIEIHNSRRNNRNGRIDINIKNDITSIYVDVFGGWNE